MPWFNALIKKLCQKFRWSLGYFELLQFSRGLDNEFEITLRFSNSDIVFLKGRYDSGEELVIDVFTRGGNV